MTENERYAMLFVQRVCMAAGSGQLTEIRAMADELANELNARDKKPTSSLFFGTGTKETQ
jgi:hypothetical protein